MKISRKNGAYILPLLVNKLTIFTYLHKVFVFGKMTYIFIEVRETWVF